MNEEYSIQELANDARKVSWVCLHCGCSIFDAAINVLDRPRRFLREYHRSMKELEKVIDKMENGQ